MRIDHLYPISSTRFRVDSTGNCTDQRQEFLDFFTAQIERNLVYFAPIKTNFRHFDQIFEIPMTIKAQPEHFTTRSDALRYATYKITKGPFD